MNISTTSFSYELALSIVNTTKYTMEFFSLPDEPSGKTTHVLFTTPDPKEVCEYLTELLLPPTQVFEEVFYSIPMFPILILYGAKKLF